MTTTNAVSPAASHRALILSAGQGSRLLPYTEQMPKCLLELGGRSMLEWQVRALAQNDIREAVVVTGFRDDLVAAEIARFDVAGISVRNLFNPFYKLADNLASCWMARSALQGPCLILNGDTLFEPAVASRLLQAPDAPVTVTIDRKAKYDADDMKVEIEGDSLRAIGKALSADRVNGESIGFLRFNADGAALFVDELERTMRLPTGPALWYLSAIDRLSKAGVEVRVASAENLQWGELDYPVDLDFTREMATAWMNGAPASWASPAVRSSSKSS